MSKSRILAEFASTPWALHPPELAKLTAVLQNWQAGIKPDAETMASIRADKAARATRREVASGASGKGIAVLPMYGVITQRGNMADDISGPGSCSTQRFASTLRAALADDSIGQILIDIDSPGGSVSGVQELADEIYSARSQKPIIGISNSLCASAAYWIGSQCSTFYCTPSGEVGSIGVYTAHTDMSKAMEMEGMNVQFISAGKYKTEGNPYMPLSPEARAAIQHSIDGYYSQFTGAVARGRGVGIAAVRDGFGQGRCLSAKDSRAAGMVDGVMTFDQVIAIMQGRKVSVSSAPSTRPTPTASAIRRIGAERPLSTDMQRQRLELEAMGLVSRKASTTSQGRHAHDPLDVARARLAMDLQMALVDVPTKSNKGTKAFKTASNTDLEFCLVELNSRIRHLPRASHQRELLANEVTRIKLEQELRACH